MSNDLSYPSYINNFGNYQKKARETAIYNPAFSINYPLLGLIGEVGEFANKYKKVIRDGKPFLRDDMVGELGDILWYLAILADDCGISLDEVAMKNLEKLLSRKVRGTLGGSGDKR